MDALPPRLLGTSDLRVTPIGLGCWQFSKRRGLAGKFWPTLEQETIRGIVKASLEGGVNWFDTAEVYGWGLSEEALAEALRDCGASPGSVIVATKWWPALRTARSITATIDERLARLGGYPISLYQVHQPFALATVGAQMAAMAQLVKAQKVRWIGVSNFSADRMRRAHAALRAQGVALVANQVKYSMLDRRIEHDGTLETAKELEIAIIAYSPLEQGLLSGKFHDDPELIRRRVGFRRFLPAFQRSTIRETRPLIDALRQIAQRHGRTPSQVALNWLLTFHGDIIVAIPGATRIEQAVENVGAMTFRLSDDDLHRLDELSRRYART
jgi:aryl-alcohol dehydrogenase-like predicted oxidoreductase